MALGRNIYNARILRGYGAQEFATLSDIDLQALRALEKRDSKTSQFTAQIAAALNLTVDQLLAGDIALKTTGEPTQQPQYLTYGSADYPEVRRVKFKLSAGMSGYALEYLNEASEPIVFQRGWYERYGYKPEKLFAVRVSGESMQPGMHDGDTIVINTESTRPKDGAAFAVNYEGELVVKRLIRDAGAWWLSSDNPDQRRYSRKLCDENVFLIGEVILKQSNTI